MIQMLRRFLFKLLTGMTLEQFVLGNVDTNQLRNNVKELQDVYTDLLKEWLNLQEAISSLQQAMLGMNDNMDAMNTSQKNIIKSISGYDLAIQQLIKLGQIHNENFAKLFKRVQQDSTNVTPNFTFNKPN